MQELQPVSGNWCWISSKRTDLRYALGHGWRFAIIFVTLGLYIYIWMHVRRHFRHLRIIAIGESESTHKSWTQSRQARLRSESQTQLNEISVNVQFELKQSKEESRGSPLKSDGERSTPTVHFTSMQSEPGNGSSKGTLLHLIQNRVNFVLMATRQRARKPLHLRTSHNHRKRTCQASPSRKSHKERRA